MTDDYTRPIRIFFNIILLFKLRIFRFIFVGICDITYILCPTRVRSRQLYMSIHAIIIWVLKDNAFYGICVILYHYIVLCHIIIYYILLCYYYYIVLRSVDLERQKRCVPVDRRSRRRRQPPSGRLFFPPWLPRVYRDLPAMTYYYNTYYGSADVGHSCETFMVHTRSCTYIYTCYNMVRTRSRKSCVRGKTREKTGTESCPCVRRLFANEYVVIIRIAIVREISLWGSESFHPVHYYCV